MDRMMDNQHEYGYKARVEDHRPRVIAIAATKKAVSPMWYWSVGAMTVAYAWVSLLLG